MIRSPRRLAAPAALVALLPAVVGAQNPAAAPAPPTSSTAQAEDGYHLTVSLLTMGPGEAVWERFGHNAIWIHDEAAGTDVAYNWGLFSFRQESFVKRFLKGEMLYWMAGFGVDETIRSYARADRTVWVQELNLTPAQRAEIKAFVEWNELPENRFYRYDYYLDNCSTRVRDAIDRVLGGQIRTAIDTVYDGRTYRDITRELMVSDIPVFTGLTLLLARMTDQPISAWEESFIPMELRDHIRGVRVIREDGTEVPLVTRERILVQSQQEPAPTERAWLTRVFLLLSALVGAVVLLLARGAAAGRRGSRVGLVLLGGVWSLLIGVFGVLIVLLWGFTNHVSAYWNENLLQANPLSLALPVLLPMLVFRGRASRLTTRLSATLAGLAAIGFVVQILPGLDQANGEIVALALPMHVALAAAVWVVSSSGAQLPSPHASG